MNKRFKTLAALGATAALAFGLSACGGGGTDNGSGDGETADIDQRCIDAAGGPKTIDDSAGDVSASPLPVGDFTSRSDVQEFEEEASWSEDTYVIGWENQTHKVDPGEQLDNAFIAVWDGETGGDCEIVPLESGGKVSTSDGANANWDLYTYQVGSKLPEGSNAALSFDNPGDSDRAISVPLWNFREDGKVSTSEVEMFRAMGDALTGE